MDWHLNDIDFNSYSFRTINDFSSYDTGYRAYQEESTWTPYSSHLHHVDSWLTPQDHPCNPNWMNHYQEPYQEFQHSNFRCGEGFQQNQFQVPIQDDTSLGSKMDQLIQNMKDAAASMTSCVEGLSSKMAKSNGKQARYEERNCPLSLQEPSHYPIKDSSYKPYPFTPKGEWIQFLKEAYDRLGAHCQKLYSEAEMFGNSKELEEELEEHKAAMDKLLSNIAWIESNGRERTSWNRDSCKKQDKKVDHGIEIHVKSKIKR